MGKEKRSIFDRFCPGCGTKLIDKSHHVGGMCGSILHYECPNPKCEKRWEENQSGIVGRPINLTEVTNRPRMPRF
jgi:hypothetical protein